MVGPCPTPGSTASWRCSRRWECLSRSRTAGGFVLGNWLDGKLGMRPWLTIGLGLLGVAAAFVQLYRTVTEAERLGGDGNGGGE
ncbi:MAG: AtpZ/AtpI family protein [Acidobacteriota bacterium]